jgi:hypothetical protein
MSVNGVNRNSKHLTVFSLKIIQLSVECQNLRRADKGEVQGIKENEDIFAPVRGQRNGLKAVIGHDSFS